MFRIAPLALLAIKGSRGTIVPKLSAVLKVSEATVYKYIQENDENLTKASALKIIREEINLTDDQILEEVKEDVEEAANQQ
jgi:deoxyribose-phosphate aldolase